MRGMTTHLTIGERVGWYRRRRGMSQEVLAGLIGRTVDWVSKIENNRAELDRLSVIKSLADALDVSLGDLLAEPSFMEWTPDSGARTIPVLRAALMNYRLITPFGGGQPSIDAPTIETLNREVSDLWTAFQAARFGYVIGRLPTLLGRTLAAADQSGVSGAAVEAQRLLGLTYQLAAVQLTKVGEVELAWIAADRGLIAARETGDPVATASLFRSVVHALLSTGRFHDAVRLTEDTAAYLQPSLSRPSAGVLSVYGTLLLAGSMAAARANDAGTVRAFLTEADDAARRLGSDANHLWTAFGPTNVAIHRVATAAELGDLQVAIDLGPRIDVSAMPMERRVRHAIEVARAYSAWNRVDDALSTLLDAERMAPEQVRYHVISRQLVLGWIRRQRGRPPQALVDLSRRLNVLSSASAG